MTHENLSSPAQKAWIVFSGQADLFWLKILRPGFRHCSLLLHDGTRWISYDPLSNYSEISVHNVPSEFDLPKWMALRGHTVVQAPLHKPDRPAPFEMFSCVAAVKRVLGIHHFFVLTPWQLYRHIQKILTSEHPSIQGETAWEA